MNVENKEIVLLTEDQVFGNDRIDLLKEIGEKCAVTDFAIVLGSQTSCYYVDYDKSLKGRTGSYYVSSPYNWIKDVFTVFENGDVSRIYPNSRYVGIRPAFSIDSNKLKEQNDLFEIEYGEYPNYAVSADLAKELEEAYNSGNLKTTGKIYTADLRDFDEYFLPFKEYENIEYEYHEKKYIRAYYRNKYSFTLSNNKEYKPGDYVWIEVSPLKWYVDKKASLAVSKNIIASGIRFCDNLSYSGNFKDSEIYDFLNTYFKKEIITAEEQKAFEEQKKSQKSNNSYGFNLSEVSEEDIIRGAIESEVPVFLHGASSEGKSSRVKQIDKDCVIIYLRNATPDFLNGKSVYNQETGEMIDVKPTWLKKLEERCERESDKLHILFFDELTNALPSIQGIAFNIVLDREVNGIWTLPKNARIVAAGNEMQDSLAANQLAEPLFNRFAHVYITTTTESWLKWARENNIHPAIYSYIAYKNGKTLRSKYDGEKPNADPRKWEMASKMLYATKNPEMLRALVGEEITKEFVEFCKQPVITLEDVINDNYTDRDIEVLNTASRHATTIGLSQVGEENLEKVREFALKLGAEFLALFDSLWTHGEESRLERIAEARLASGGNKQWIKKKETY